MSRVASVASIFGAKAPELCRSVTREGTAQCPSNRLGQSRTQRAQTDACRTAAFWRRALSHLSADRLQQDRFHRLCEPSTAQIVDPSQTEDHGIRSLAQVHLSTEGFHSCFTLLQVVRTFEPFRTVLLQRPQLQIVVRPCMVDGHSIWQFQEDGKESYPKAVRVPANPREIADRAFYAAPSLRRVEVANGIQHVGIAAWQTCQQLQIVKLPPTVISLAEGTFQGRYVLREVAAPGCVQCGRRVFAERCSLGRVGASHETEDSNVLAPGAQLGKYAFESCLTLTTITFDMDLY